MAGAGTPKEQKRGRCDGPIEVKEAASSRAEHDSEAPIATGQTRQNCLRYSRSTSARVNPISRNILSSSAARCRRPRAISRQNRIVSTARPKRLPDLIDTAEPCSSVSAVPDVMINLPYMTVAVQSPRWRPLCRVVMTELAGSCTQQISRRRNLCFSHFRQKFPKVVSPEATISWLQQLKHI